MSKKISWQPQEDEILERTMVESLKNGLDQSQAAEIVANFLPNRTEGACLTRWHLKLRKKYQHLVPSKSELHKRGREVKIDLVQQNLEHSQVVNSIQTIMDHIKDLELLNQTLKTENVLLNSEREITNVQNETLQKQLDIANKKIVELQQDYDAVLRVIEMARKTVVKEETNFIKDEKVAFKMDKNGNLERVVK